MKNIGFLLFIYLFGNSVFAQGIAFVSGSWSEVVAKAKSEDKLIFIDIYTTWCGPCKLMDKNLFPNPMAGAKYNQHFINYKIDAEKGEGLELADKFNVQAYPTNLFIDPVTEEVVFTALGYCELDEFLHRADVALAEKADPLNLKEYQIQYARKNFDQDFLERYIKKLKRLEKDNDEQMDDYLNRYVKGKPNSSIVDFMKQNVGSMSSRTFDYLMNLPSERTSASSNEWIQSTVWPTFDKAVKKKDTLLLEKLERVMQQYSLYDHFWEKDQMRLRFYQMNAEDSIARQLQFDLAEKLLATHLKKFREEDKRSWNDYQLKQSKKNLQGVKTLAETDPLLFRKVSDKAASFLNSAAWQVFENDKAEREIILHAQRWSAHSLKLIDEKHPNWPMYADTYAHLLFRSGADQEAINQQRKAIEVAKVTNPDRVKELQKSLEELLKQTKQAR